MAGGALLSAKDIACRLTAEQLQQRVAPLLACMRAPQQGPMDSCLSGEAAAFMLDMDEGCAADALLPGIWPVHDMQQPQEKGEYITCSP